MMPDARRAADVEQLFLAHQRSLWRFAYRLCGDPELASDAVQETFARLVERESDLPVHRGWLFRVATSVALEALRTQRRRWWILQRAPLRVPTADPVPAPDAVAESNDRRRLVSAALAALSPRDRTALLLREEGFSHREIAEAIETTTGSVGTIIARALDRLAKHLPLDAKEL